MLLVRDRDFFVCEYCATFHFPSENPDGVRALGTKSDHTCPVCRTRLEGAQIDQVPVEHCAKCNGVLVAHGNFGLIVQLRRAARRDGPAPARPIDPEELERRLRCPSCRGVFLTHPYYGGGTVVIDTCARCDLVWLDRGEIARVARA